MPIGYRTKDWRELIELSGGQVNTQPQMWPEPEDMTPDVRRRWEAYQYPSTGQGMGFQNPPDWLERIGNFLRPAGIVNPRTPGEVGKVIGSAAFMSSPGLGTSATALGIGGKVLQAAKGVDIALNPLAWPKAATSRLAERTTGGKLIPKAEPLFDEALDIIKTKVIPAQKAARESTKKLYQQARAPAFEEVAEVLGKPQGEALVKQASEKLALGRLPRAEFEQVESLLTQAHKDAIINNLATNPNLIKAADKFSAMVAMKRIFSPLKYVADHPQISDAVPPNTPFRNFEIKLFERAWGKKVADEMADAIVGMAAKPLDEATMAYLRTLPNLGKNLAMFKNTPREKAMRILRAVGAGALDALGIPKALKFSFDMSYLLRQGFIMGVRHPVAWGKSVPIYFKTLFGKPFQSREIASKYIAELIADPEIARAVAHQGIDFYSVAKGASWYARPETLASRIAEKIPGVGRSNWGAAAFMNGLMARVAVQNERIMVKMGASEGEYKAMGELINWLGGRGTLPKFLQGTAGDVLNKLLTSPRYVSSRFEIPFKLFSSSKIVRQETASTLVSWAGLVTTITALAYANGARIELDPRSSDAYKIKIGNKRLDLWVGYAQIYRFLAQMATGQRKTAEGEIVPISRKDILFRFMESKEAPGIGALGVLLSLREGEVTTFTGQKLDLKTLAGWAGFVKETLSPAVLEELVEAYRLEGAGSAALSGLEFIGAGMSTYETSEDTTSLFQDNVPSGVKKSAPKKKSIFEGNKPRR